MKTMEKTWDKVVYDLHNETNIGRKALQGLLDDRYAAIVLKNAIAPEILDSAIDIVQDYYEKATVTSYANGALTTIGPYLAKHLHGVDRYFQEAQLTESVFPNGNNLAQYVRERLRSIFALNSIETAVEDDGRRYAPFIIRLHADGVTNPLHNDNIKRDAASTDLSLARLTSQLSCIVCLQECDAGGQLFHYQKRWSIEDEEHKIPAGIGYDYAVVKDKPCFVFKPQKGDIYLIDPTNYHEIRQVSGATRLTLGFFMGFFDSSLSDAVVWS
ncbi:MAG: hypothetical protein N5P05_000420 [Chroococcopsis gigantea SAG 12.99]|jgi:hypothetical protein|nr:hypothetical protein [Chroococcopsis gigantea SAG 12.99]